MARIVKNRDVRRSEILEVAQRLFYQKGYEQTSIQDIINEIGIAKGTFYHYFGSKQELLDAIIEWMVGQTLQTLQPVVEDEQLSALEKFNQYFAQAENWKVENKTFFLDILRSWYNDDNAIFRHKIETASIREVIPTLAKIIEQGIAEGVFAAHDPVEIAEIIMGIGYQFSRSIAATLLDTAANEYCLPQVEKKVTAVQFAIERVLNAPAGSITVFDIERTKHWFD
ncbi:MAG: hypothetical protein FOGNACKC_03482 [Anaerolineae bacterium]|nr:hypothetical protein [Anaerolineae bacterium]